jgi:predicted RNase H-like HicB family nuclease
MTQPLEHYLKLHYPATLVAEPEGGYTALIPDLPGCVTVGQTGDQAMEMLEDARHLWLETAYQYGDAIPLPNIAGQDQ